MPDQQERGGYSPGPPHDTDEFKGGVPWTGRLSLVGTVFVTIGLLFVAMTVVALVGASKRIDAQQKFVASCIEFHSGDRCLEFWRYGRTDLARRN